MSTGVLLLNMGGPGSLSEVRPFLFRLFRDPDILPLPRWLRWLAWPLALLISTLRAPKSRKAYAAIGGKSPQLPTNLEVAAKLEAALKADGSAVLVTVAMRYWHPFTDEALDQLEAAGVERIVVLPMYPQYSTTTTMSSFRELHRRLAKRAARWRPALLPVLHYHLDPGYVTAVARRLASTLKQLGDASKPAVIFSAHSIPMDRVREDGDPYPREVQAMVDLLVAELPPGLPAHIAYQSRVGPVQWQGPEIAQVITELAQLGHDALIVVPISFVSEHVETLEELDQEYRHLAESLGIKTFLRVPTVQADDDFVEFLAQRTRRALAGEVDTHGCLRSGGGGACVCLNRPGV